MAHAAVPPAPPPLAVPVAVPTPAPATVKVVKESTSSFAGIAAVGAAFAGFVSHADNPDWLATGFAVGLTFFGAFVALHVLHLAFKLAATLGKIAVPLAVVLGVGCALDWQWAETLVDWLGILGARILDAAANAWTGLQAR
ncbi:MAG: hypothetical protein NXI31_21055 [bacterium]|nr:hypothetical protein [bacterium]